MHNESVYSTPASDNDVLSARERVRRAICQQIRAGELRAGTKLPTADELAQQFHTSRSNVHKTIRQLAQDGWVEAFRRRGTFVRQTPPATVALDRANSPRVKQVHLIKPESGSVADVDSGATLAMPIYQFEEAMNARGIRVVHVPVSHAPSPAEIGEVVRRLTPDASRGLALMANLGASIQRRCEPQDDATLLLPYVQALRGYAGRICWFNWAGLPLTRWPFHSVSFMPFQEGLAAGQYLVQNRVKRVVWIGVEMAAWSAMRHDGLAVALKDDAELNPTLAEHWFAPRVRAQRQLTLDMFRRILLEEVPHGGQPAFVVCGDEYASWLLDIARSQGMDCPRDFCVIAFDNADPTCGHNLTTVAPPVSKIGPLMARILLEDAPSQGGPVTVRLPSFVIERSTFVAPR